MDDAFTFWVMNATADDWESLEQILPDVASSYRPTTASAVATEVIRLLRLGLFEAMPQAPASEEEITATPVEYWFRMTEAGRATWEAAARKLVKAAQAELKVEFPAQSIERMHELSAKARAEALSEDEDKEAGAYERFGVVLDILHSQSRRVLKRFSS